jgi:hypothetical protein
MATSATIFATGLNIGRDRRVSATPSIRENPIESTVSAIGGLDGWPGDCAPALGCEGIDSLTYIHEDRQALIVGPILDDMRHYRRPERDGTGRVPRRSPGLPLARARVAPHINRHITVYKQIQPGPTTGGDPSFPQYPIKRIKG